MGETFLCNICAEDLSDLSKKVVLKCNPQHIFCYDCIYDWYFKNKKNTNSASSGNMYKYATCPICQKDGGFLTLPEGKLSIENIHFPILSLYVYKQCICVNKENNGIYFPCNSSASNTLSVSPDKLLHLCYNHSYKYKKGESITIKNNNNNYENIESIYGKKACSVTLKSGNLCSGNANPQKNGNYISIEKDETKYCVCKRHAEDFLLNKVLMIKNKQIIKEDIKDVSGLCGSLLTSSLLCKKKGNEKYGGKCCIHKDKTKEKESAKTEEDSDDLKVSYIKIKEDYETLYEKLNNTFAFFKNNVDKTVLENKVKYLETIVENIKNSIQYIGTTETSSKVEDVSMNIKYKLESNVNELKNGIDDFDTLVNKVFNKDENKDVFEELNKEIKESKKELKIDLYNPEFMIDPHCNVKQKNGKLCNNPANIYYNLKCYKHHHDHYLKEKLTNNDNLYLIKAKVQHVKKEKEKK